MQRIINYVSGKYGLSLTDLNSKSRTANINECRQMVWILTRELFTYSNAYIGAECGNRDTSTVLMGIKRISGLIDTDSDLKAKYQAYYNDLNNLISEEKYLSANPYIIERIELFEKRIAELEMMVK